MKLLARSSKKKDAATATTINNPIKPTLAASSYDSDQPEDDTNDWYTHRNAHLVFIFSLMWSFFITNSLTLLSTFTEQLIFNFVLILTTPNCSNSLLANVPVTDANFKKKFLRISLVLLSNTPCFYHDNLRLGLLFILLVIGCGNYLGLGLSYRSMFFQCFSAVLCRILQ